MNGADRALQFLRNLSGFYSGVQHILAIVDRPHLSMADLQDEARSLWLRLQPELGADVFNHEHWPQTLFGPSPLPDIRRR
jgi:hypothetical protein